MAARSHAPAVAKAEKASAAAGGQSAGAEAAPVNPVWSLLATHVQRKMSVSAPDDPYEREADQVADRVLRMPDRSPVDPLRPSSSFVSSSFSRRAPAVQRKCKACEDEDEMVLQRKPVDGGAAERRESRLPVAALVGHAFGDPGRPLDRSNRDYFEQRFGADFGHVRVHTGSRAADAATSLRARAFTVGADIAFARAQYAPATSDGRRLLAHELTHVAQQGRAPALARGGAPAVAPAGSAVPGVQRAPGDNPGLLKDLQDEIDAAKADADQDDDVMARAHGARLYFLYKYFAHPTLSSQSVLDDFIDKLEKEAETELGALSDPTNPFTADFALDNCPKGFPLTWSGRVHAALSLGADPATILKEWNEAFTALKKQAETLGDAIFAHGLPIPMDDTSRLKNFKLRLADSNATNSPAIAEYARNGIAYTKLKWLQVFAISWETFVDDLAGAIADGDEVVDPADYKDFVDNKQSILRALPDRARERLAMTEEEAEALETQAVGLADVALAVGMASALYSIFGILGGWSDASDLFDKALVSADARVAGTGKSDRIVTAMQWAWDNDYYSGAAKEWAQNLISHGASILGEIALIVILGMIPGVNIAVAVYLALTVARDVLGMIGELAAALNDCMNAANVAELQLASIRLARILTNGAIFILIVLVTEGVGKAASRLRKEAAELRAADTTLTAEAAEKKAMEKLPAEERAALEEGTAKLARKFESEIGSACSLGSINCRVKLPDHIEKEAGTYPTGQSVPKPAGPFSVQKSILTGAERGTELLRDRARANRTNWPEFDKALTKAEKAGSDWPIGPDGNPWEVHHVKPVFFGGTSEVENLFPLPKPTHQAYSNWWNAVHRAFKKRFTEIEWNKIYWNKKDVPGSKVPLTPK